MELTIAEKIDLLEKQLKKVDIFFNKLGLQIQDIVNEHKRSGGHIEYAYIQHFYREITGLSKLFQYLLKDSSNRKYVFFPVRSSIEILLYSEYIFKLAGEDGNKILDLLSRDMAQTWASANAAAPASDDNPANGTLKKISMVNKFLETKFDLTRIKLNSKVFPDIRALCDQSNFNLKDSYGSDIYHIYSIYSESSHLRLGNEYSISKDINIDICWALEYFIEIYIKFYDLILKAVKFDDEYVKEISLIKQILSIT